MSDEERDVVGSPLASPPASRPVSNMSSIRPDSNVGSMRKLKSQMSAVQKDALMYRSPRASIPDGNSRSGSMQRSGSGHNSIRTPLRHSSTVESGVVILEAEVSAQP